MIHRARLSLAAPFLALAFLTSVPGAWAQAPQPPHPPEPPSLIVTGQALIEAEADQVELSLSVVTEAKESSVAAEDNNRKAAQIHEALRAAGLEAGEISTGRFTVQPIYTGDNRRRISGFRVQNSIDIRSPQIALAGDFIQQALNAGANNVENVRFTLSNRDSARATAIRDAVRKARAEATAAAAAAGVQISGVRRITINQHFDQPRPYQRMELAMAGRDSAEPPPLVAGSVPVEANVTIEFNISPGRPQQD